MSRLLFALLLAASYLNASSFTYTSCTAGNFTLSPCDSNVALTSGGLVSPHYVVRAYAAIPSPFEVGYQVSAFAEGLAQLNAPVGSIPLSGIAEAKDDITYESAGPPRLGLIQFQVVLVYSHEEPSSVSAMITDGLHVYDFSGSGPNCRIRSCKYVGTLPFDLGTSFESSASAMALANYQGGGSESDVSFELFEADSTTPVGYFVASPEPAGFGLESLGLGFLVFALCTHRDRQQAAR